MGIFRFGLGIRHHRARSGLFVFFLFVAKPRTVLRRIFAAREVRLADFALCFVVDSEIHRHLTIVRRVPHLDRDVAGWANLRVAE